MKTLLLLRLTTKIDRTLGWEFILDDDGISILWKLAILEPPWRRNARGAWDGASRIIPGQYRARAEIHPEKGWVIRLENAHGRKGILQHRGTRPEDTQGCQCFGARFAKTWDGPCDCRAAQEKMSRLIPAGEEVLVKIVDLA